MTATLTKWYEEHGRHQSTPETATCRSESTEHSMHLDPEAMAAAAQSDLDAKGIAKTARDEKLKARHDQHGPAYHAAMERLYREHILHEAPAPPVIQIQGLGKKPHETTESTTIN